MRYLAILIMILGFGSIGQSADQAEECFSAEPLQPLDEDACGSVDANIVLKDCLTGDVHKSFKATMGFDCSDKPIKLKLLYNDKMLVVEYSNFDQKPNFQISKTYILDQSRVPSQVTTRVVPGDKCFSMVPLEKINSETCEPVRAEIQFRSCKTNKPEGLKFDVTTHYTCGEHQALKYWYKKMMLVAKLYRTPQGIKVKNTYSLKYPSIYGVYNDRNTSSASTKD